MRLVRALLVAAGCAAVLYPLGARELARRRTLARVERLRADACPTDDAAISLRLRRLGPLLSSWETIGGCGAGGATGVGVRWIGHNTTGGLFSFQLMNNYIVIPSSIKPGQGGGGFNEVLNVQLGKDFIFDPWNGAWTFDVLVPYVYKHYNNVSYLGGTAVSNGGVGDVSLYLARKFGTDNSTQATLIGGVPTGSYTATYLGTSLTPDEQLGFGRLTATLQVDHTFDQDWGLVIVGGNLGYRGGRQSDKLLWIFNHPSEHNYRAPSASLYTYAGWFAGPVVPGVGFNVTGYTTQDTRGDFGETLDAPVTVGAGHVSLEWSNPYLAVLAGVYVPIALRGTDWNTSPTANYGRYLQPWTIAVGLSASPF